MSRAAAAHVVGGAPPYMVIKRVWIEDGCISCNLCEDVCPDVFEVPAGELSKLRKGHERHLNSDAESAARVREAADSCPVEVIKLETD